MRFHRPVSTIALLGALTGIAQADQTEALLQDGSYEVTFRIELPHVENWAIDKKTTICLPHAGAMSKTPLPILSGNNPLAKCPARHILRDGDILKFDIVCEGRNAAKARAVYALTPSGFKGRIAMVMGAKNMTMTEVQVGHRIGSCDLASAPQN